jgi:hypothetical protein
VVSCEDILMNFLVASGAGGGAARAPAVAVEVGDVAEDPRAQGLSSVGSHYGVRSPPFPSY